MTQPQQEASYASARSSRSMIVDAFCIVKLRRKIEADPSSPRYLKTVFGVGYRLEDPDA